MEFTAEQIAEFLNGEVVGNKEAKVWTFAKIEEGTTGALSFLSNMKYAQYLYETKSSVVAAAEEQYQKGLVAEIRPGKQV